MGAERIDCRCVSLDAAECARIRYRRYIDGIGDGLNDPCDCQCHEEFEAQFDDEGFDLASPTTEQEQAE